MSQPSKDNRSPGTLFDGPIPTNPRDDLYPPAVVKGIADTLPCFFNPYRRKRLGKIIKIWAGWYIDSLPENETPAKAIRTKLANVHKKAVGLFEAINNIDDKTRWHLAWSMEPKRRRQDKPPTSASFPTRGYKEIGETKERIARLANAANVDIGPQKRGTPAVHARRLGVCELAEIYLYVSGQKPTRRSRSRSGGEEYGPFRDFVVAVLRPIHVHDAEKNVEGLMEDAIARMKKSEWKTGIIKSINNSMG